MKILIILYTFLFISSYSQTYDNQLIDFFYSGRNIYTYDGISTPIFHSGFMYNIDGFSIDQTFIDPTYQDAFVVKYNHGEPFPKYVDPWEVNHFFFYQGETRITDDERENASIGFWIDRTELNGNGILAKSTGGTIWIISNSNLSLEGYENELWIVFRVVGDYSYLIYKARDYIPENNTLYFRLAIYNSSTNDVTQLTFYNPTLIYSQSIDPYIRYTSLSEKDTSLFRSNRILYVGDSQYNDGYFHSKLAEYTGAVIIDEHWGGYRMAYSSTSWFYQDTIKNKVFAIPNVHLYFFPISSNDNTGGNLRDSAIDSVIYFYPFYGDPVDSVTAKLARFASLSESDKALIFGFKQTYAAYIEQIQALNPMAKIIIGSIPIGAGSGTMTGELDSLGHGIWIPPYSPEERILNHLPSLELKREDIIEVSEKCNTEYIDLMGTFDGNGYTTGDGVRLDFYNFNQFCADGVHWDLQNGEIKKRIAILLKEELKSGNYTAIEIDRRPANSYLLEQNYPNPFNPTTMIKYKITGLSFVSLKVYDLLGCEIQTLINEEQSSGNYKIEFNGSKLSSGVYFYQLRAGDFIQTKKMVLLR